MNSGAVAELAVVTPSYLPDLDLCGDLNRSVMELTAREVTHHIIVPAKDLPAFRHLASARTQIHDVREFLPRTFFKAPGVNVWVNAARPWPPVRGWITQQVVKLAIVARLDVPGALLLDSDSVLVRPVTLDSFRINGRIGMYRLPAGVDQSLPGHRLWHGSARELLGLAPPPDGDLADYICWPCLWEPAVVRGLIDHIEETTGMRWTTAVARQLRFSEMMLYGVYVDEVLGGKDATFTEMHGIVHSDEVALNLPQIRELLNSATGNKLLVMLSAKSGIPLATRRQAIQEFLDQLSDASRTAEQ